MALSAHVYPQAQQKLATKALNLSSDSLRVILLTSYTYANTHATLADVLGAGTEVGTGGGYTSGGYLGGLALSSVSLSTSALVTTLTCANPVWSSSTITASFAVFFDAQGASSNGTAFPLVYWDFGGSQSSTSANFTLQISGSGLLTFTAS